MIGAVRNASIERVSFLFINYLNFVVMAIFDSNLLGKVTKSVGNVTMCYTNKKNIAKAKVFKRKDKPTSEILDQRARMKVLVQLARRLLAVIRKGFEGTGNGTTSNAFVKENMGAVSVAEGHVATIEFEQLKVASGILRVPEVTATYSAETSKYLFEQAGDEDEDAFSLVNDKVYAVLFETALKRLKIVALRDRGESGSTSFPLPKNWDTTKVVAYCFATSKNGKLVSDSDYLSIE